MTSTSYRRFDAQSSWALRVASECYTQQRLVPWSHRSPSTLFIYLSHRTPPWEKNNQSRRKREAETPRAPGSALNTVWARRGAGRAVKGRALDPGQWTMYCVGRGGVSLFVIELVTPRDPPSPSPTTHCLGGRALPFVLNERKWSIKHNTETFSSPQVRGIFVS